MFFIWLQNAFQENALILTLSVTCFHFISFLILLRFVLSFFLFYVLSIHDQKVIFTIFFFFFSFFLLVFFLLKFVSGWILIKILCFLVVDELCLRKWTYLWINKKNDISKVCNEILKKNTIKIHRAKGHKFVIRFFMLFYYVSTKKVHSADDVDELNNILLIDHECYFNIIYNNNFLSHFPIVLSIWTIILLMFCYKKKLISPALFQSINRCRNFW